MKKNICPYLDSQNRCTHKTFCVEKKAPYCIYSNALKCRLYNEWESKIKLITKLPSYVLKDIENSVRLYKRRWFK